MACIGIFVGQCGVTIGLQILASNPPTLACYDGSQHAIFIDTEIKVIRRVPKQLLRSKNTFSDFPGCGGCFAKGFSSAESFIDKIMEKIRVEIERSDCCMGFMLVHSLCGGTGSGYGSRITEELKSLYPEMFAVNVAVLPFRSGENPIQSYNVLLATSKLQQHSDMIVLVENSVVGQELAGKQKVSMTQVNDKIVSDLQIILRNCKQVPKRCAMWEVMKIVCSVPTVKFCSLGSHHGRDMTENIDRSVRSIKQRTGFGKFKSLSGVVLSSDSKFQFLDQRLESKISKSFNFVNWNPFPVEFWCCQNKQKGINYAINNEMIVKSLLSETDAALLKFHASAYLHWFSQYNVEKDEFSHAFEAMDKICRDYRYSCT